LPSPKQLIEQRHALMQEFHALATSDDLERWNIEGDMRHLPRLVSQMRARAAVYPPIGEVAREIAERILSPQFQTMTALAHEYRPFLEHIGKLEPFSGGESLRRRFREFCKEFVDPLLETHELPLSVRKGLASGGLRRIKR
jgi:hypothetical protein